MRTFTRSITSALTILLTAITFFSGKAQTPSIKVDGKESNLVYLQKLGVQVTISGTVATTTWTMTFANKTNRILEGQLDFPLPEGISISRYALDLNSKMREAVPVEKEKGTRVFEQIERRRVDPGLLEKVDGNSFRTRIYPITPHGARTVLIAYEQELSPGRSRAMRYHLPLAFSQVLEAFEVNISVVRGNVKPVIEENIDNALQFDEWQDTWSATRSWTNYKADNSLTILVPITKDGAMSMMQQSANHYFYNVSAFPAQKKIEKQLAHRITILWDVSLSGLSRNTEKEMELLDEYFGKVKNLFVTLVQFSNTVRESREFTVHDGEWDQLHIALKNVIYDGGTQFGALDLAKYPCDEFLLFSDGHSNFGDHEMPLAGKPVYAIISAAKSDFPYLRYITETSGGELINLDTTTPAEAKDRLFYQNLYFLGVKKQDGLDESYPSLPALVGNGISVAGISEQPVADLVLQFGYGGKVVSEIKFHLDYNSQKTSRPDLTRVWAQKKIAELDKRYDDNKLEIGQLGRRYGIVTRNTSLIVLETVQDYINYDIEPPAELREEYDRIMKQRGQTTRLIREAVKDNALVYFNELMKWWQTDRSTVDLVPVPTGPAPRFVPDSNVPVPVTPAPRPVRDPTEPVSTTQHADLPLRALEGRVAGLDVQPAPGANGNIRIRGAASASPNQSRQMGEVVVTGYGTARKRNVTSSTTTVQNSDIEADKTDFQSLSGFYDLSDPDGSKPALAGTGGHIKTLTAEIKTAYLARLKKARPEDQYKVYLDARKENVSTPLFYFNTANFFFDAGKKDLGIRVLSNIAELEVESYELYKLMGYKLRAVRETAAASATFKKVLDWRPFEPQSYRDYALALQDAGQYQQALDTLYAGLIKNYDANIRALYPGIEETILPEINNLVALHTDKINFSRIPKELLTNMPVDIRVVLNWNMSDTDMDLWVTDPANEKCYYSHRSTAIGGRISHDFTRGLGPEQFMLKKAVKGKYKVEVNYYGDSQTKIAGPTTIMVEIYTHYGAPQQTRKLIPLQMQSSTERTVLIGEFDFE